MDEGHGKKAAGGILAALAALGAGVAGMADDCGRLAARGGGLADDVAVSSSRFGDDLARAGGSSDDLARLGAHGDDLAHTRYGGLGAFGESGDDLGRGVLGEGASSPRLADDTLETVAEATIDIGGEVVSFATDEGDDEAPYVDDVRVLGLAPAPLELSMPDLDALDTALAEPSPGMDLLVLRARRGELFRVEGGASRHAPSLAAILARCQDLGRECVLLVCEDAPDGERCLTDASVIASSFARSRPLSLERLVRARDASESSAHIALHRLARAPGTERMQLVTSRARQ